MASFSQRKSGWWQAKIRRTGFPDISESFSTKVEAQIWARHIESGMDKGKFIQSDVANRTLFSELATRFENDFAPHHYRANGWVHKLAHLVRHLGKYSLSGLNPERVAHYREARLSEPDLRYKDAKNAPRVSGSTVKTELDLLSKVIDVAQKEFCIALPYGNPVASIRKPAQPRGRDYRLTSSEWNSLLVSCKRSQNHWMYAAVMLAVELAVRQGELRGLEWKDVDYRRRIAILRVKAGANKTGEERAVPLSSTAIEILQSLPSSGGELVIPLGKQTLYSSFKTACRRAGVPHYRWHDIRHEALSRLSERGNFSVIEIASISGHKTLQMLNRYTHLQAENLAAKLG